MKILYLTGREIDYPRNDVVRRALQHLGTVQVSSTPQSGPLLWKSTVVFLRALPALLSRRYDLVVVGFYGHLLMLPIALLAQRPILFDAFVSTFDTLCFDRQVWSPRSLPGRLAFWLDRTACHLASRVLVDTPLQVEYFAHTFALDSNQVHALPVGCNEDIFCPRPADSNAFDVVYYCTYQPLHGADVVVRAAALLRSQADLHFRLIGAGPTYVGVRQLADQLGADNITFVESVPLTDLPEEIAAAHICLGGPFGTSGKASRVIPGKVYQILAMARPLIAGDTPANRDLLVPGDSALLCAPGSAEELAQAILRLHQDADLRDHLAARGRARYLECASEGAIAEHLSRLVLEMTQ